MTRKLLFVDDDATFRRVMARELASLGYDVESCASGSEALQCFGACQPVVAVVDLRLPGIDGMELLERLLELDRDLPVILMTGHGGVPDAVHAMRLGAYDFLTKPASLDVVEQTLRRASERRELLSENRRLRDLLHQPAAIEILGDSAAAVALRQMVAKLSASPANVLITGENGTGKELVARCLHEQGPRREHPFVVVNCGAVPEGLIESELFGHERGAFTGADRKRIGCFEAAHDGTIFLDEVGELPLASQPVMLRVLQFGELRPVGATQTRKVDVRVIAATNRDLLAEVEAGRFREDLYYRLSTLTIEVPPLRARTADIAPLVQLFLARHNAGRRDAPAAVLAAGAIEQLTARAWPGNVRELENAVTRLVTLAESPTITAADVERWVPDRARRANAAALPTLDVEELERLAVLEAMKRHNDDKKAAAAELGVSLKTLYNKLHRYGM